MKKIAVIILCIHLFCGCSKVSHYDIYGDLLKVNDITYNCCNITIPDKRVIGSAISKVKNKMDSIQAVSGTALKNGDSLSLKEGTVIYEIKGIDVKDMVAAKWNNDRYIVYVNCEKTDAIKNRLRNDIENSEVIRFREFKNGIVDKNREIYDLQTVNNIKEAIYNAEECEEELEEFSEFYEMEFLTSDTNGIYKPSLGILCRTNDKVRYGVIYDNGIKRINLDIRNIMK